MAFVLWPFSYRYLTRLDVPTTESERTRVESVLGAMRAVLAILALISFSIETAEPARFAHLVYILLILWVIHSVAVYLWVANRPITPFLLGALHIGDIVWPTVITAFSHGSSSPFISMYSFALIAAGFRWGFPEALLTSVAGSLVLEIEAFCLRGTPWGEYEGNRLLARSAYLLVLGYLIGTLGENEKERRAESRVVNRLLHAARSEHSMGTVLQAVFDEFQSIFLGSHVFLATQDLTTDQVYLWETHVERQYDARPYSREIVTADRLDYLLPDYSPAFFCKQVSPNAIRMLALAPRAQAHIVTGTLPALPFLPEGTKSLLAVTAELDHAWRLRFFIADAKLGKNMLQELAFASSLFMQASNATYGVYLMRRLRTRASAIERARVARELHDGVVQSLISAEMRADILRRRAEKQFPPIAPEVGSLQSLLRIQVAELRELMHQMKPVEVEPDQLLDHLAEQVDRFRRYSGISARFVSTAEEVHLSAHACREILLIVREALVNVRKHAKAEDVLVTFGRQDGSWRLTISDDGVGFGFEGTLAGAELMKSARGPAIIKERVANLGGELCINSQAPRGSQLLIKLPQKNYIPYGQ